MVEPAQPLQLRLFEPPRPVWRGIPHERSLAQPDAAIEGGAFDYQRIPGLLLGRIGVGPLRVAWDTNVLIDYADLAPVIWGEEPETYARTKRGCQLAALHTFMELWLLRDIRIHVFEGQMEDAKRKMSEERKARRRRQLDEIPRALTCLGHDTPDVGEDQAIGAYLAEVPPNFDRELVECAYNAGCHVVLTNDKGILTAAAELGSIGLRASSTDRFMEELTAAGETSLAVVGGLLAPDLHKLTHLIGACE